MEIILASGSPRRKELLGLCCPDFRVEVSGADEHVTETLSPEQLVARLAEKKASEVASRFPEAAVIGSDTVVELDGEILGKPTAGRRPFPCCGACPDGSTGSTPQCRSSRRRAAVRW